MLRDDSPSSVATCGSPAALRRISLLGLLAKQQAQVNEPTAAGIIALASGLLVVVTRRPVARWNSRAGEWEHKNHPVRPGYDSPQRYERLQLGAGLTLLLVGAVLIIVGLVVQ